MFKSVIGYISLLLIADLAVAVEKSQVSERYALVGVIAESNGSANQSGIVVIRDKQTDKNLTLRSGDILPDGLRVSSIKRNNIVLTVAGEKILITYAGSSTTKKEKVQLNPQLEELYKAQLEELEDRFIDEHQIVHIYEDGSLPYIPDQENVDGGTTTNNDDSKRLWRPVRTGENLKYILESEASGRDNEVLQEIQLEENDQ